jgi:hypothetical protein
MCNSFPRPLHSDLVGGPCHKGLPDDQLTVQEQSWCIHRPFVPTEQAPKESHTQETGQPPRNAAALRNTD